MSSTCGLNNDHRFDGKDHKSSLLSLTKELIGRPLQLRSRPVTLTKIPLALHNRSKLSWLLQVSTL